MSFPARTDFCGLSDVSSLSDAIRCNGGNENVEVSTYAPTGQDGAIIAMETFGENAAADNTYDVKADLSVEAGDIKINSVVEIGGKKFALESFEIGTSNSGAPTLSATAKQVESGATDETQCLVSVPAFSVKKKHHAQILFGAFSMNTTGCSLIECSASVGGSVDRDIGETGIFGSDVSNIKITVTGRILQYGDTKPVLTVTEGWKLTGPLSLSSPASQYNEYTFTVEKPLAKDS